MKVYAQGDAGPVHVGWADVDEQADGLEFLILAPYAHLPWINDEFRIVSLEQSLANGWRWHERVVLLQTWQDGASLPGWRPIEGQDAAAR